MVYFQISFLTSEAVLGYSQDDIRSLMLYEVLRACSTPRQNYYVLSKQNSNSPTRTYRGYNQVRKAQLVVIYKCLLLPSPDMTVVCKEGKAKIS